MNRRSGFLIAALWLTGSMLGGCSPADSRSEPPRETSDVISDATITVSVKLALAFERGVKASEINVGTDRGTVTLYGEVGSQAERQLAVKVTEDVSGVKAIVNRIHVRS
jgi:osmotically-inducible protein OsmY